MPPQAAWFWLPLQPVSGFCKCSRSLRALCLSRMLSWERFNSRQPQTFPPWRPRLHIPSRAQSTHMLRHTHAQMHAHLHTCTCAHTHLPTSRWQCSSLLVLFPLSSTCEQGQLQPHPLTFRHCQAILDSSTFAPQMPRSSLSNQSLGLFWYALLIKGRYRRKESNASMPTPLYSLSPDSSPLNHPWYGQWSNAHMGGLRFCFRIQGTWHILHCFLHLETVKSLTQEGVLYLLLCHTGKITIWISFVQVFIYLLASTMWQTQIRSWDSFRQCGLVLILG